MMRNQSQNIEQSQSFLPSGSMVEDWEVIVIGAGPAGSLAAIQLARQGIRVLLVDKAKFPRTKVCGSCLSGKAIKVLKALKLDAALLAAVPLKTFRLATCQREVVLGTEGGYAISRRQLDQQLATIAQAAGVVFQDATTASLGNLREGMREVILTNKSERSPTVRAKLVLVCAGLGNADLSGSLPVNESLMSNPSIGLTCLLPPDGRFEPGQIEMSVHRKGYVGVTSVEDGQINVSAAIRKQTLGGSQRITQVIQQVIGEAGLTVPFIPESTRWLGTRELTRTVQIPGAKRALVLGDAAGYVEPFTGEGMAWAMEAAVKVQPFVNQALSRWDPIILDQWTKICRKQSRSRQRTCHWIKRLTARPILIRSAIEVLRSFPALARPFIHSIHGKSNTSLEKNK